MHKFVSTHAHIRKNFFEKERKQGEGWKKCSSFKLLPFFLAFAVEREKIKTFHYFTHLLLERKGGKDTSKSFLRTLRSEILFESGVSKFEKALFHVKCAKEVCSDFKTLYSTTFPFPNSKSFLDWRTPGQLFNYQRFKERLILRYVWAESRKARFSVLPREFFFCPPTPFSQSPFEKPTHDINKKNHYYSLNARYCCCCYEKFEGNCYYY